MMQPIGWHEECLAKMVASLAREEASLALLRLEVAALRNRVAVLAERVDDAKQRGLTEFEPERLLKRRG